MPSLLSNYDFMRSTEVVGQMLSEKDVEIIFAGTQAQTGYDKAGNPTNITLPMLSENVDDVMRTYIKGFLDHESAHVLYTDGPIFRKRIEKIEKKYGGKVAQMVLMLFNVAEDARIEELMKKRYKGSKENFSNVLKMILEKNMSGLKEDSSAEEIIDGMIVFYARWLVGSEFATEFFNEHQEYLELCKKYDEGIDNLYTLMSKAKSSEEILDVIEEFLKKHEDKMSFSMKESSGGSSKKDKKSEGSGKSVKTEKKSEESEEEEKDSEKPSEKDDKKDDSEKSKDSEDKDGEPDKDRKDKEGEDGDREKDEEASSEEDELTKEIEKLITGEDFGDSIRAEIKKIIRQENGSGKAPKVYRPLTTRYDRIEPQSVKSYSIQSFLERNPRTYKEFLEETAQYSSVIQKQLERYMSALSVSGWEYGHKKGCLYGAGLSRLITGDERVFRKKMERKTKDVAVSLLIDLSGSMMGTPVKYACMSAYIFAKALSKIGINFEILGFTTDWNEPRDSFFQTLKKTEEKAFDGQPSYTRIEPLNMPIFKKFGDKFSIETAQTLCYFSDSECPMNNNVDGECVLIASSRLLAQPQKRKILFVFSDGDPAFQTNYSVWEKKHLHYAIEQVTKAHIETFGIGICSDSVKKFYPHYSIVNEIEDLGKETLTQLKKFLVR
jgi:cobalamin biosynthesis protein CobT